MRGGWAMEHRVESESRPPIHILNSGILGSGFPLSGDRRQTEGLLHGVKYRDLWGT